MPRLTGWWDRRSDAARIELYTRWSFPLFAITELSIILGPIVGAKASVGLRTAATALVVIHTVLSTVLSNRGVDWALGRRERSTGLFVAVAALSAAGPVTALALHAAGAVDYAASASLVAGLSGFGLGALALAVRGKRDCRRVAACVPGAGSAVGVLSLLMGLPGSEALSNGIVVFLLSGVMVATNRGSAWLLGTVWELDAAREVQAQLAVADERLRFGRDLHDVIGRNLAVIALKSELAVQLARRGRPEAAEQMIEVQRIARESQREVRDVVRNYRTADLGVELSGALAVLRAADVKGQALWDEAMPLPTQVQAALAWVIREAVTNVLRHSEARRCVIRLTTDADVVLSIENDGVPASVTPDRNSRGHRTGTVGPDGPHASGGSGLTGLRERLTALGGTLAAEQQAAGRFRLTATIPLQDRHNARASHPELREAGLPA
jgi:two-component system sensor histidine kinase DesK